MALAFGPISGIVSTVRRGLNLATRRLDSSLRSHRPQRSLCRCASSGLNKSLFASVGPNSQLRDHRQNISPGRMKPARGHRLDGTPNLQSIADISGVSEIPPRIIHIGSGSLLFVFPFFGSGFIGCGQMIGPLANLIESPVFHHGVNGSQQSSSHSHIGFGFAYFLDQTLSSGFLAGVGPAKSHSGFAQGPTQGSRASLGDISGLGSSGGFFEVGGHTSPELQGIGVGESIKGSDFGGNDTVPDLGNAGDALQDGYLSREVLTAVGHDDLSLQNLALAFDQQDDIGEVGESLPLDILEQVATGQEPSLSGGPVELGTANVGSQEYRPHVVLGSREAQTELSPVSSQLTQLHEGLISDESQGTIASSQSAGDIQGVVPISFSSLSPAVGQFSSVGDIDSIDTRPIAIDEPFDEADSLDRHPGGSGQIQEPVLDFIDALGIGGDFGNDLSLGVDSREGDAGLMQVDTGEGSEADGSLFTNTGFVRSVIHDKNLRVRGRKKLKRTWKSNRFHRPLHGFTLIELLVVIAIIALLVSILLPSLQNAKALARSVFCSSQQRGLALAVFLYGADNNDSVIHQWTPHTNSAPYQSLYTFWPCLLGEYLGGPPDENDNYDIANGARMLPALVCPEWQIAETATEDYGGDIYDLAAAQRSMYQLNSYACINIYAEGMGWPNQYPNIRTLGQQKAPSSTYVAIEAPSCGQIFVTPGTWVGLTEDSIGWGSLFDMRKAAYFRHPNEVMNISFLDGHVEPISYPLPHVPSRNTRPWSSE